MIQGSCCCGAVQFTLAAPPSMLGTCHCSRCRKVGASAIAFVKHQDLTWVQGKENITLYKPGAPYKFERSFCKTCGTSLGEILADEENLVIAANTLDTECGLKNQFHEFVAEKPAWYVIGDDAKQFEAHPTNE